MNSSRSPGCPAWCVSLHDDSDQWHRDAGAQFAVIALDVSSRPSPLELLMLLHQGADDPTAWIYLGDGTEQRLELSLESLVRVLAGVSDRLARLGFGPLLQENDSVDFGPGGQSLDRS